MPDDKTAATSRTSRSLIHFNTSSLALFSLALITGTGLLTAILLSRFAKPEPAKSPRDAHPTATDLKPQGETPAWGELVTYDIDLEQPEEYVGFEFATNTAPQWVFAGMNSEKTRNTLIDCGLSEELADQALAKPLTTTVAGRTIVRPDKQLLFALTPEIRAKLYATLARLPGNHYMEYPFCFPRKAFELWFGNGAKDSHLIAVVRKLLYRRGDSYCFSDFEYLMEQARPGEERMKIVKALSRQSAVLARIRVRPDTDIDKLLGYWGRGIQMKDVRPLLESTARLPDGATISLLYFLPKFARERLYTFPLPSKEGDPVMDCHWSTMNFFNDPPSDKFADPGYTVSFIQTNFYQVAVPSLYGDIILILNGQGNAIHSAVYLADDIVFTKNGNNISQPWMLMRIGDLMGRYTEDAPPKMAVYRHRNQ